MKKPYTYLTILGIVAIILAAGAFWTSHSSYPSELTEKQTLEIAQKALTDRLYGINLACVDFDGIRENGVVTYNVFIKSPAVCSPSILKEPVTIQVNVVTGTTTATVGHPIQTGQQASAPYY